MGSIKTKSGIWSSKTKTEVAMKENYAIITICSLLISLLSTSVHGQEGSEKKTIEYEVKKEKSTDGQRQNHVIKITADGETKVLTWDGEGEMPEEMQAEMDGVVFHEDQDGEVKTIVIDREVRRGDMRATRNHQVRKMHKEDENHPRVRLGIMMEDGDQGVRVTDVFKGTAADEAGLKQGDVILKIDDHYIFTGGTLMKVLSKYGEGDDITVRFLRDGEEQTASGSLTLRD